MWSRFLAGSSAYEECFAGGVDDFGGDGSQVVDLSDAVDLGEQSVDEAEVAAGDAGDGGDRDGLGVIVVAGDRVVGVPAPGEDDGELVGVEGAVSSDRQLPGSSSAVTAGSASWVRAVWKMPKFPVIQRAVSLSLAIRHPLEVRSNRFV